MRQHCVKNDITGSVRTVNEDISGQRTCFLSRLTRWLCTGVLFLVFSPAYAQVTLDTSLRMDFPLFARVSLPRALREDRELLRLPTGSEWRDLGFPETGWLQSLELTQSVSDSRIYYLASTRSVQSKTLDIYLIQESADSRVYHTFNLEKTGDGTLVGYTRKIPEEVGITKAVNQVGPRNNQELPASSEYVNEQSNQKSESIVNQAVVPKEPSLTIASPKMPSATAAAGAENNPVVVTDDLSVTIGEYLRKQRQQGSAGEVEPNVSDAKAVLSVEQDKNPESPLLAGEAAIDSATSKQSTPEILEQTLKPVKDVSESAERVAGNEQGGSQVLSSNRPHLGQSQVYVSEVLTVIFSVWVTILTFMVVRNRRRFLRRVSSNSEERSSRPDTAYESSLQQGAVVKDTRANYQLNPLSGVEQMSVNTAVANPKGEEHSSLAYVLMRAAEEADRMEAESKRGALSAERARVARQQQEILFECATALQSTSYARISEPDELINSTKISDDASGSGASSTSDASRVAAGTPPDGGDSSDPRQLRVPIKGEQVNVNPKGGRITAPNNPGRPTRPKAPPSLAKKAGDAEMPGEPPNVPTKTELKNPAISDATGQGTSIADLSKFDLGEQYSLALVYLNMGESDTARDLLRELAKTGNPREKAEAMKVLKENFDD